jgi:hypothetical protein
MAEPFVLNYNSPAASLPEEYRLSHASAPSTHSYNRSPVDTSTSGDLQVATSSPDDKPKYDKEEAKECPHKGDPEHVHRNFSPFRLHYDYRKDVRKFIFFSAQQGSDIFLQSRSRINEAKTNEPALDLTIPTLNFMRPRYEYAPGLATAASTEELAGAYSRSAVRLPRALNGGTHFESSSETDFYDLLMNNLLTPVGDYYHTTGMLGAPFLYHKESGFNRGMGYAYGGAFYARALALPMESQQIQDPWIDASGCTDDTVDRFNVDPPEGYAAGQCDEYQDDIGDGTGWLAGSNDPEPDYENEPKKDNTLPEYDLITSTIWITDQYGAAYRLSEQFNASAGFFQSIENPNGPGWEYGIGAGALILGQWGLAAGSGQPLDTERKVTSFLTTGLGAAQAASTNDPSVMSAYADQNFLIGLNRYHSDITGVANQLDPQDNSDLAKTTVIAGNITAGVMHARGGTSFGVAFPSATLPEKLTLGGSVAAHHTIAWVETGTNLAEGHDVLRPALINEGLFIGGTALGMTVGQMDNGWGKSVRFLANNTSVGRTDDGTAVLSFNGEW